MNKIRALWPTVPDEPFLEELIHNFLYQTSTESLKWATCASCAEKVTMQDTYVVSDIEMNLTPLTCPDKLPLTPKSARHSSETFGIDSLLLDVPVPCPNWPNTLLDPAGIIHNDHDTHLHLCPTCHHHLSKGHTPPLALANMMYVSNQPPELQDLRPFEETMIALCRGMCTILQLRQTTGTPDNNQTCAPNMQKGLRGHTIIFPQQPQAVANILPPSIEDVTSPICVVFVGDKPLSKKWLAEKAKPLAVRGNKVCLSLFINHKTNPNMMLG